MSKLTKFVFGTAVAIASSVSFAVPVTPVIYNMQNGNSGSYHYWDESYSGSGNTSQDRAFLSEGTGDLTDGIIATQNWNVTEAPTGPGPYVGWLGSATVDFIFEPNQTIKSITVYYDDSNGYGGVSTPNSIRLIDDGTDLGTVFIADPATSAPGSYTWLFGGNGLSVTDLTMTINPRNNAWAFISEVSFDDGRTASQVPEPASLALLGLGLAGLGAMRRNKR